MKVLVLGGGGREHALCWKLARSKMVEELYCAPGNPGIAKVRLTHGAYARRVNVSAEFKNFVRLFNFAWDKDIDLVVVGPEEPLVDGITDAFLASSKQVYVFGPTRKAARLESSKVFAKRFMWRHGIPTAPGVCGRPGGTSGLAAMYGYIAEYFSRHVNGKLVVKADGLAQGKGVFVCDTQAQTREIVYGLAHGSMPGGAGTGVVIEEYLDGREISYHIITNGESWWELPAAQDFKRLTKDTKSAMTGSMGTIAPIGLSSKLKRRIVERIIEPTLAGCRKDGLHFNGVLYFDLMIVDSEEGEEEPIVLEYNVRFGDTEAQAILPIIEDDIVPVLWRVAQGSSPRSIVTGRPVFMPSYAMPYSVCVAMASDPYQEAVVPHPLEEFDGLYVFHSGTKLAEDGVTLLAPAGKKAILNVVAVKNVLADAKALANAVVQRQRWPGAQWREDILI